MGAKRPKSLVSNILNSIPESYILQLHFSYTFTDAIHSGVFLRLRKDDKDEKSRFCLSMCSYQLLAYTSCSIRNLKDGGCLEIKRKGGGHLIPHSPPVCPRKSPSKFLLFVLRHFMQKNVTHRTFHESDFSGI